jgi:hypothetical protein
MISDAVDSMVEDPKDIGAEVSNAVIGSRSSHQQSRALPFSATILDSRPRNTLDGS